MGPYGSGSPATCRTCEKFQVWAGGNEGMVSATRHEGEK